MDRRESLKSLFVGTVAGGLALNGCTPEAPDTETKPLVEGKGYGRTEKEKIRDQKLHEEEFLVASELETLAILCDIILPPTAEFGSATDAGVPEFIAFMAKDIPRYQTPLRGGLMWLDNRSNAKFGLYFKACSVDQQIELVEEIAYPEEQPSALAPGIAFFSLIRNLTLTGYYTTEMGFKELGYIGNTPGVWDGVPDEVLKDHGMSYDPKWIKRCVDQSKRNDVAAWDEEGNLIT